MKNRATFACLMAAALAAPAPALAQTGKQQMTPEQMQQQLRRGYVEAPAKPGTGPAELLHETDRRNVVPRQNVLRGEIDNGAKSGSLTSAEATKLRGDLARIQGLIDRNQANWNRLSDQAKIAHHARRSRDGDPEGERIGKAQNDLERDIRKALSNNQRDRNHDGKVDKPRPK